MLHKQKRRRKSRELAHDVQRELGAVRKKAIQDDGALVSAFVKLLAAETRKHRSWIAQKRTRAIGALHAQERNVQSILKQRESVQSRVAKLDSSLSKDVRMTQMQMAKRRSGMEISMKQCVSASRRQKASRVRSASLFRDLSKLFNENL